MLFHHLSLSQAALSIHPLQNSTCSAVKGQRFLGEEEGSQILEAVSFPGFEGSPIAWLLPLRDADWFAEAGRDKAEGCVRQGA